MQRQQQPIPLHQKGLFASVHGIPQPDSPDRSMASHTAAASPQMRGSGKHLTLDRVEGELNQSFHFGGHNRIRRAGHSNTPKSAIPRRVRVESKASSLASTSKNIIHHTPISPSKKLKKLTPLTPSSPHLPKKPSIFNFQRKAKHTSTTPDRKSSRVVDNEYDDPASPSHSRLFDTPDITHTSPSFVSTPATSHHSNFQERELPAAKKPSFLARQRSRLFASSSPSKPPTSSKGPHADPEPTTPEKMMKARKARSGVDYGNGLPTPVSAYVFRPQRVAVKEKKEERMSTPVHLDKTKVSTGTTGSTSRSLRRIGESIKKRLRSVSSPLQDRDESDAPVPIWQQQQDNRWSRIPLPSRFTRPNSNAFTPPHSHSKSHSRGHSISSINSRISQASSDLELELELSARRRPGSKELPTIGRDQNGFFVSPSSVRNSFAPSKLSTTLHTDEDSQRIHDEYLDEESMSFTAVMPRVVPAIPQQFRDEETVIFSRETSATPVGSPLTTAVANRKRRKITQGGETTQMLEDLIEAVVHLDEPSGSSDDEDDQGEDNDFAQEEENEEEGGFEASMSMSVSTSQSSDGHSPIERPANGDRMLREIDSEISLSRAVDSPSKQSRRDFAILHRRPGDDSNEDFTSWSFHPSRSASASIQDREKERKGSPLRFAEFGEDVFLNRRQRRFCDSPLKFHTDGSDDDCHEPIFQPSTFVSSSREVTPEYFHPFDRSFSREESPLNPEDISAVIAEESQRSRETEIEDQSYQSYQERETSPGSESFSQSSLHRDFREFSPESEGIFEIARNASDREFSPVSDSRPFSPPREFSQSPSDQESYLVSREMSPDSPTPDLRRRFDTREVSPAESWSKMFPSTPFEELSTMKPMEMSTDLSIRINNAFNDKSNSYIESTRVQLDDVDTALFNQLDNPIPSSPTSSSLQFNINAGDVPITPDKDKNPFGRLRARSRDLVGTSAKRLRPKRRGQSSYKKSVLRDIIHEEVERSSWQQHLVNLSPGSVSEDPFSLTGIMDELADEEREHEKKLKWIHFERAAWREIVQSRNGWPDTAKSVAAVIGFDPPRTAVLVLEFLEASRVRFQALVHESPKLRSPFKRWKNSALDTTPVKFTFTISPGSSPTKDMSLSPTRSPWDNDACLFSRQLDELSFSSPVKKLRPKKRGDLSSESSLTINRINSFASSPEKDPQKLTPTRLVPRIRSKRPQPQTSFENSVGPILAGNMTRSRKEALQDAVAKLEGKDGSLKLKDKKPAETPSPKEFSLEGEGQLVNISPIHRRVRRRPPIRRSQLQ